MKCQVTTRSVKLVVTALMAIIGLASCSDPRRVAWSPDGSVAAVIAGDGLRFCDAEGSLGQPAAPSVELVCWFSDSRRIMVVEYEPVLKWSQVVELEPADDVRITLETAKKMLAEAKLHKGHWKEFEKAISKLPHAREAVLYLRDNKDKEMSATDDGGTWAQIKKNVAVGVHRVCSYNVENKSLSGRKQIYLTMRDVKEIRMSPKSNALLLVSHQESGDDAPYTLMHITIDSGKVRTISGIAAMYPDWSKDGTQIFYIEADLPSKALNGLDTSLIPLFGSLHALPVDPSTEHVIEKAENKVLSHVFFSENSRIRCLADGSLVFSSLPITLPVGDSQVTHHQTLFQIRPGQNALVVPMVPPDVGQDVNADAVEYFEVSSDGKHILIPGTSNGVSIYSVLNGAAVRIDGKGFDGTKRLTFSPSFRNADEVCLGMAPVEDSDKKVKKDVKSEVVLWSISKDSATSLSKTWPESAKKKFLY
ncbi:MAG: hypothetical protein K2X93_04455 [Candidatus Obscuribacterales bacterium]|nr:hypothetical protein [Candidatus Obscuribacterales bacterium]